VWDLPPGVLLCRDVLLRRAKGYVSAVLAREDPVGCAEEALGVLVWDEWELVGYIAAGQEAEAFVGTDYLIPVAQIGREMRWCAVGILGRRANSPVGEMLE